jgi:hypothetical protein
MTKEENQENSQFYKFLSTYISIYFFSLYFETNLSLSLRLNKCLQDKKKRESGNISTPDKLLKIHDKIIIIIFNIHIQGDYSYNVQ